MDIKKLEMWLASNSKKLPEGKMFQLKDAMSQMTDEQFNYIQAVEMRDPNTVLLISIFIGELGVDRFMVGDTILGVLKLITCGLSGTWWLIDLFLIQDRAKEYNYGKIKDALMGQGITIY